MQYRVVYKKGKRLRKGLQFKEEGERQKKRRALKQGRETEIGVSVQG
jgi:hypothetical protein